MKNNYFLLHGSFSCPFSNWIPYLREKIIANIKIDGEEKLVYTPEFPTGVGNQNYERWAKILDVYVDSQLINENTIIFAHSIAPVFISKYLVERKIKVKRLVFVCGFNNYLGINEDYDQVNKSMYFDNLLDIKKYCSDIICIYSDNDPYVKFESEVEFANTVTDKQIIIPGGGHLNSESGYSEFSELLKYIN